MTRIFILFALFAFLFPGCRSRPDQATGQVRISVWTSNNPFELEWTRQVVDRWRQIHPEIQVTSQPIPEGRSSEEILMASVVARTTPDVFLNLSPAIVERLRQAGALLPVSSFETLDSFLRKRLPPESYRMFVSPDGKLYQIPWKCNPIMTYYNKRIFRELGLAPPRTYSEWFRCASAVRESKQNRWMISLNTSAIWWQRFFDLYPLYVAASGGRMLFDSEGKPTFRNKDFVAVTEFLKANFEHQYTPLEEAPGDPFIQQKVAVRFTGPWIIPAIEEAAQKDFEYDVAPLPAPDSYPDNLPVYTFGDPKNIGIFATSRSPGESAQFVQFLLSEEHDALLVQICKQLVYRDGLAKLPRFQEIFRKNPVLRKFADQVPYTRSVDHSLHLMEILDVISGDYVDAVIRRKRTIPDALAQAERNVRLLLSDD